jgi:hypothetical protein
MIEEYAKQETSMKQALLATCFTLVSCLALSSASAELHGIILWGESINRSQMDIKRKTWDIRI